MSNIDHVMKAPTQADHEAKPIETFGGGFNATSPPSKSARAPSPALAPTRSSSPPAEADMPCSTVTAFAAKAAPPACRRPLFRR